MDEKDIKIQELEEKIKSNKLNRDIISWINIIGGLILIGILVFALIRKLGY
jgi:hypothetical protein